MKKTILALLCFLVLSSCGSNTKLDEAKKDILSPSDSQEISTDVQETIATDLWVDEPRTTQKSNTVEVSPITNTQFIEISPISGDSFDDGEAIIEWKTLGTVDKIEVLFANSSSQFPDDRYTLQTFKSGDESFKYVASSRFQVLDFWINTYLIKAYSGKEISETEVILELLDKKDTTVSFEEKIIGTEDDSIAFKAPTSELFGEPLSLWTESFTYSGIEWLEINKQDVTDINCEWLTEYLTEKADSWFFWNTCKDIIKDKGISFYVIELTGDDSYVYTKHYIDYTHNFYGTLVVESGTGVTKETISSKNTELKEENETFTQVSVVDSLFRNIVSQN